MGRCSQSVRQSSVRSFDFLFLALKPCQIKRTTAPITMISINPTTLTPSQPFWQVGKVLSISWVTLLQPGTREWFPLHCVDWCFRRCPEPFGGGGGPPVYGRGGHTLIHPKGRMKTCMGWTPRERPIPRSSIRLIWDSWDSQGQKC